MLMKRSLFRLVGIGMLLCAQTGCAARSEKARVFAEATAGTRIALVNQSGAALKYRYVSVDVRQNQGPGLETSSTGSLTLNLDWKSLEPGESMMLTAAAGSILSLSYVTKAGDKQQDFRVDNSQQYTVTAKGVSTGPIQSELPTIRFGS